MPIFIRVGFGFFFNAFLLASWLTRLPDVLTRLDIDKATLGLALFAAPAGSLALVPFMGGLIDRHSPGKVLLVSGLLLSGSVMLLGPPTEVLMLAAALFLAGSINAGMEVSLNANADRVETLTGEKIMSRAHGFWSLGYMAGALVAGGFAEAGISYPVHLAVVGAVGVGAIGFAVRALPKGVFDIKHRDPDAPKPPAFALPNRITIGVCIMVVGVTLAEGAVYDWGPLYLRSDIGTTPFWASVAYASFTLAMAAGRMGGDWVRHRMDAPTIVRGCSLLTAIGLVAFVASPNVVAATASLALMGLGVSLVFPISVSAVAARGGPSAAANMAGLTLMVLSSLMLAPPVIGLVAEGFGLATALLCMLPCVALTAALAGEAAARPAAPTPLPPVREAA